MTALFSSVKTIMYVSLHPFRYLNLLLCLIPNCHIGYITVAKSDSSVNRTIGNGAYLG